MSSSPSLLKFYSSQVKSGLPPVFAFLMLKERFYIFRWLRKTQNENTTLWLMKIMWNLNFSVHKFVLLEHSHAHLLLSVIALAQRQWNQVLVTETIWPVTAYGNPWPRKKTKNQKNTGFRIQSSRSHFQTPAHPTIVRSWANSPVGASSVLVCLQVWWHLLYRLAMSLTLRR